MGHEPFFQSIVRCVSEGLTRSRQRLAEPDKRLHIQWSFWLTLAAHVLWPAIWAIGAVFAVGLAKEFWDRCYGSGFCFIDLGCNVIGITAGAVLCAFLPKGVFS